MERVGGSAPADDREVLRAAMRNATCMIDAGRAAGLSAYRDDDIAWVVAPDEPHPALNTVRPVRQHAGLADLIPDIVATYPTHVPVAWWLTSDDGHDELAAALSGAGFELSAALPAIAGSIPEAPAGPPPDVVIVQPTSEHDWTDVVEVQREGFALPPTTSATIVRSVRALGDTEGGSPTLQVALARRAGIPVAVGIVSHGERVAGLWSLTTLPAARGHGVGGAMIDHRLALGRTRGAEIAFMFSSGDAEPLYAARGFRRIGTCEIYVLAPRHR